MASDMNGNMKEAVKNASESTLLRFSLQATIGLLMTVVVGLQSWALLKINTMGEAISSHTTSIAGLKETMANEHSDTTKQLDYVNSIILSKGAQRDAQLTDIKIAAVHVGDQAETLSEKFDDWRKLMADKWNEEDAKFQAIWTAISRIQAATVKDTRH